MNDIHIQFLTSLLHFTNITLVFLVFLIGFGYGTGLRSKVEIKVIQGIW
jgi:hypothetical protein